MSEVALIDGQQLTPSSFGETDDDSGIWKPKDLSDLTFGSNGFYLKFDDSSSLGADSSGNTNNFTLSTCILPTKRLIHLLIILLF